MFYKTRLYGGFVSEPIYIFIGCVIGLVVLVVHELLHAIVYPKEATVSIGIISKQFVAVALASYPLSRVRFILMCLLPYILGMIPFIGFLFSPLDNSLLNGILFGAMCFGLISPYPDLYNVFLVMKNSPTKAMIQFIDDELYWFYE